MLERRPQIIFSGDLPLQGDDLFYREDINADEPTRRAREALISVGLLPGGEEIIRAGLLDHVHGMQVALEVQRQAIIPLSEFPLANAQVSARMSKDAITKVVHEPMSRFWKWCARVARQFFHIRLRHERIHRKARNLERQVAELRDDLERAQWQIEDFKKGSWVEGIRVALIPGTRQLAECAWNRISMAYEACQTEEERKCLSELLKNAHVERFIKRETGEINLTLTAPKMDFPDEFEHECSRCMRYHGRQPYVVANLICPSCGSDSRRITPGYTASDKSSQLAKRIEDAKRAFDMTAAETRTLIHRGGPKPAERQYR